MTCQTQSMTSRRHSSSKAPAERFAWTAWIASERIAAAVEFAAASVDGDAAVPYSHTRSVPVLTVELGVAVVHRDSDVLAAVAPLVLLV